MKYYESYVYFDFIILDIFILINYWVVETHVFSQLFLGDV